MADLQTQPPTSSAGAKPRDIRVNLAIPPTSIAMPTLSTAARLRNHLGLDTYSPVNQNGSFEFDRVIKSGYVQKRTQKTKAWRTIYLVLRPNALSIYKSDKEEKLRHKIYLSDLTAVTLLKDPKNKRPNVFGLFSPSKNYHFQAPTLKDAQEWAELIRQDARIEEEEEEMFLASPVAGQRFFKGVQFDTDVNRLVSDAERIASSSPEPLEPQPRTRFPASPRRPSQVDSSGMSGAELASHSDFSDSDVQRFPGASIESLAVKSPPGSSAQPRPGMGPVNASQISGINIEHDPDRVIWQGWMWFLRSKGGVRQWKKSWAVLRPRNLILYKDETEYSVLFLVYLSSIVNVVDIDPTSRKKRHCLQIITDEKSYKFCTSDEEALVRCLGAFKSLLAKRRELEAKVAASVDAGTSA
ncbi:hypothetical protein B0T26DRAFT_246839 [Lasiosphaeria miniovina]|uniref:PH domain-containing protein n=1 Tax=Lasiosphaeria miniovina TaxID=1954250 RepID=A0AA40AW30_9PEZI|nr:uncharacterized protein B0T26DRAFT_246839 [Lasiosphaeria miniovina]KAK0723057.1 hypothetical protein B0T26DRAFT_246839 [Lasiosphaeria miniovina]